MYFLFKYCIETIELYYQRTNLMNLRGPEMDFKEFESIEIETFDTILSGLNLNRRSNSLNSAIGYLKLFNPTEFIV